MAKAALLSAIGVVAVVGLWLRTGGLPEGEGETPVRPDAAPTGPQEAAGTVGGTPEASPPGWTLADDRAVLRGETMGTTFSVSLAGRHDLADLGRYGDVARDALESVNREMSTYQPDSAINRLSRAPAGPFELSPNFAAVMRTARVVYEASGGAFDPSVGPLVRAWGFGPDGEMEAPKDLEALRARLGFDALTVRGEGANLVVDKGRAEVELDFSAIAKGFGADQACAALRSQGLEDYMVEVGGEVCVRGQSPAKRPWRVGIERPSDTEVPGGGGVALAVNLGADGSRAIATSGDYRNYYERDGVRLSHTIDPRTGRPIAHTLASVSVLADDAMTADAWATALSVLGPEEGLALATQQGLAVFMLVRVDGEGAAFEERMTPEFATLQPHAAPAAAPEGGSPPSP